MVRGWAVAVWLLAMGCGEGAKPGGDTADTGRTTAVGDTGGQGPGDTASTTPPPSHEGCEAVTPLLRLEESPCPSWSDDVRGRVARQGPGSAVVWSRRTDGGYGLVASAVHTLGVGWFGAGGEDVAERLQVPEQHGVLRMNVPPANGDFGLPDLSPLYSLYNPDIPGDQNDDFMADILPRHDVFLGLVDAHRVVYDGMGPFPTSPRRAPGLVELFDPADLSRTEPMGPEPDAGALLLLVGYPQDGTSYPDGAMSVARVLADDDADAAIAALADRGDAEGDVAYDAEVELLAEGSALVGMSGGGAFDVQGRWVGTLVRASDAHDGSQIIRIVRSSYLAGRVRTACDALTPDARAEVLPYLDALLVP